MLKKLLIIIILLTLIISPRIILGFRNEKLARQAADEGFRKAQLEQYEASQESFKRAAEEFELAAQRLFWRNDLWNETGKLKVLSEQKVEAILAYEKAQEKGVLVAYGREDLGILYTWRDGNYDRAIPLWEDGLKQYPKHFAYYYRLAVAYREEGNYAAERNTLKNWLAKVESDKHLGYFHYRYGVLLILDSPEEALDELTRAANLDEGLAPAVETLRTSLNLALLESDPAEKQILLGRGLALVEEWQLAEIIFANATQAQSTNASAWAWLGETKQHLDKDPVPALNKAFNLNPDSTLVRSLRGLYWRRQGNYEKALEDTQTLIKLDPENAHWYATLGEIYAISGDLPPALLAYQEAVELAPKDALYWHLLALFSVQYGMQVEEIGLPAAQKALDLNPKNARYADTLGRIYFDLAQDENAEKEFLNALNLDPDLGAAHLHLGVYYLKYNHRNLAYQSLLRARELSQDSFVGEQATRLLEEYFQE